MFKVGSIVRSKADNSILGMMLPAPLNGWNAVKLSMSDNPYKGEACIGTLFNCTPQCWEEISEWDYAALAKAGRAFCDWLEAGTVCMEYTHH